MSTQERTQKQAIYRLIPQYFDNDDGFVQRIDIGASDPNDFHFRNEDDRKRLLWTLKDKIRTYRNRPPDDQLDTFEFKFKEHHVVKRTLQPEVFLCNRCHRMYTIRELGRTKNHQISFNCLTHNCAGNVLQIPLLWIHSRCGSVEAIRPRNCQTCNERLRLYINNNDIGKSYWSCTHCNYTTEQIRGNGPARLFHNWCQVCATNPAAAGDHYMRPVPAIKVYRPQSFSTFNRVGDWKTVVAQWFHIKEPEPDLSGLPSALIEAMKSDPEFKASVLSKMPAPPGGPLNDLMTRLGLSEENFDPHIKQELMEFAGLNQLKEEGYLENKTEAESISKRFGVSVYYMDGLPIIEGTYGSLIGTGEKENTRLVLIDGPTSLEKWVFVREFRTEGLLFQLDESAVTQWLSRNGHPIVNLRETLLRGDNSSVNLQIKSLMHSMSHLLIRKSEIFSGVSRETLAEFLFPHALSFLIYNTQGSELGMLRTTFDASMYKWLHAARGGAAECVYDPICSDRRTPCHGCMHIAERNCPLFNGFLDRDLIVPVRGEHIGYWN
jgi:hypothetical protein